MVPDDSVQDGGGGIAVFNGRSAEPMGFATAVAAIAMTARLDVSGTVETGGPIARLGQRLIGNVSKMMQDRFFACLQGKLS